MKAKTKHWNPNFSAPKEYPQGFNPPMRFICALHRYPSGSVWLFRFNSSIGEWEPVREATAVDRALWQESDTFRCYMHPRYTSGCKRCAAEVKAELEAARPAPAGSEEDAR